RGGEGIVAALPAHDLALAAAVLEAVAPFAGALRVRLVPSVGGPIIARFVQELLPTAELLGPIADERSFATLAGTADVVVAVDPADPFERRALVAAGVGTAAVTTAGGPTEVVLGGATLAANLGSDQLRDAVERALEQAADRRERARQIEQTCGEHATDARLRTLP